MKRMDHAEKHGTCGNGGGSNFFFWTPAEKEMINKITPMLGSGSEGRGTLRLIPENHRYHISNTTQLVLDLYLKRVLILK